MNTSTNQTSQLIARIIGMGGSLEIKQRGMDIDVSVVLPGRGVFKTARRSMNEALAAVVRRIEIDEEKQS